MIPKTHYDAIIGVLDEKFNLIQKLGKGSTATVYLGYLPDDYSGKVYAFKTIDPSIVDITLFEREVKMLNLISHENVLQIYYSGIGELKKPNGKAKRVFYIILEYLMYGELLDFIYLAKGFGEDYGRLITLFLLNAIEAVHNSGIVHRDIKVDNIMLTNDFNIKLVDFGFATLASQGKLTTYLGTPNYAAPELLLKTPYYGVCNDIFSLAVTIFVIVTGTLPFKLPVPNDPLYRFIFTNNYEAYWEQRKVNVSDSFMALFNNLLASDYSQRPTISEIRTSQWMKELDLELLPKLKMEFKERSALVKNKQKRLLVEKEERRKAPKKKFGNKIYKHCSLDSHQVEEELKAKAIKKTDSERKGKYFIEYKQPEPLCINIKGIANVYSSLLTSFKRHCYSIEEDKEGVGMCIKKDSEEIKVKLKTIGDNIIIVKMKRMYGAKDDFLKLFEVILSKRDYPL